MTDIKTDTFPAEINPLTPTAITSDRGVVRALLTVMRPHQWVKNLFVIAPLLFSGRLNNPESVLNALLGFLSFCALSSSVYIFNDWWDVNDDRAHPEKRNRPLCSGSLSASVALVLSAALLTTGLLVAVVVGWQFAVVGSLYAALMAAYCIVIKRLIILDAMTIACGFVLRVLAGALAVGVAATHWLIACTFLLALFLAFAKRRQELLSLSTNAYEHREVLGHYSVKYLEKVIDIVVGASIVCYALYTVAAETTGRFGTDKLVYGTAFVIYGLLRYLALINDPTKGGNPSRVLLTDAPLLFTIAGWAIYNAAVIYRHSLATLLGFDIG